MLPQGIILASDAVSEGNEREEFGSILIAKKHLWGTFVRPSRNGWFASNSGGVGSVVRPLCSFCKLQTLVIHKNAMNQYAIACDCPLMHLPSVRGVPSGVLTVEASLLLR